MKIRKATSGIQRKYLKYTIGLLLLALFLSSMGVWFYMRNIMMGIVTDKYTFITACVVRVVAYSSFNSNFRKLRISSLNWGFR